MPISPTPSFLIKVHYLAASVRRFGGALAASPIIVTVGGDESVDLTETQPWSRRLGVQWRWLDADLWRRHGIFATALQRFCYDIQTPTALLLDADTLFLAPIDDLLERIERTRAIAGLIAHLSPFLWSEAGQGLWREVFHAAGLGEPPMSCEHSGWQSIEHDAARRHCPPYFNLGVLLASREALGALAKTIYSEMEAVERVIETPFRCQLALTLAIQRARVPWEALPLRYNLPNDDRFLARHGDEVGDVRVIHYLRDEEVSRSEDLASPEGIGELLAREDLHPINIRLRDALRELHGGVLAAA
ncbi:MAG TPA: hypothetical protein VMU32_05595 [Solirubrobacteraceae bacterium]|nr:hypothetical protein [Solirubrobacteraceae bacterium]